MGLGGSDVLEPATDTVLYPIAQLKTGYSEKNAENGILLIQGLKYPDYSDRFSNLISRQKVTYIYPLKYNESFLNYQSLTNFNYLLH